MISKFSFKILFWIVTKSSPTLVELYNWSWTQNYVLMKMWRFSRFLFEWRSEESPEDWECESRGHQCERESCWSFSALSMFVSTVSDCLDCISRYQLTITSRHWLHLLLSECFYSDAVFIYLSYRQTTKCAPFINSEIFPIYLVLAPSVGNEQHPSCNCFLTREKIFNFN